MSLNVAVVRGEGACSGERGAVWKRGGGVWAVVLVVWCCI
jgi:hypothetical protein